MEPEQAIQNIKDRVAPKLKELEKKAQDLYDKNVDSLDIWAIHEEALNYISEEFCQEMYGCDRSKVRFTHEDYIHYPKYHHFPSMQYIDKLCRDRERQVKNMTVGDLQKYLDNFPKDSPVVFRVWESCMTDSGTDMGGEEDYAISRSYNMNSRIEITLERK